MLTHGFFPSGGASGSFAPTYNPGDNQYPFELDWAEANYEYSNYGPGTSSADCDLWLVAVASASDTVITIEAIEDGSGTNQGGRAIAPRNVFTLNVRADEIKVELISGAYVDSDHTNYPSTNTILGSITDGVFFSPANGIDYGYGLNASVQAQVGGSPPPTGSENGQMISRIRFTFRKAGYYDLSVDYEVRCEAQAIAEDVS